MIWVLAYAALACFVSMVVAILVGIRLARELCRAETRYARLLAKYIVATELTEEPEVPGWVNTPRVPDAA